MKTIFFLLLFSFSLSAQVIIKERLEIQPKATRLSQKNITALSDTTTWVDIHYSYLPCDYQYIPWPGMGGLTRLELSTGQMDTIALTARFKDYSVWYFVRCPTIGPVPLGTTAEVKNYNGAEYHYGESPPFPTATITYQQTSPTTTDVYRSINYENGSGPTELHGTIHYTAVPKPTVIITNTKIKQYTFHSASPNYTPTFTCSATPSGKYAPTITWSPQQTFNTKDYLNKIKPGDTLRIPVTVTATNIAGTASDTTGKLILIRSKELHHIKVFANPDSIYEGDSSIVTLKAYRFDSTEITGTLPSDMKVTLTHTGIGRLNVDSTTLGEMLAGKVKFLSTSSPIFPAAKFPMGVQPQPMAITLGTATITALLQTFSNSTKVTVKKKPTVKITYPSDNSKITATITAEPKMPTLTATAVVSGTNWNGTYYFNWKCKIGWKDKMNHFWWWEFYDNLSSPNNTCTWTMNFGNKIIGGDSVVIEVIAVAEGAQSADTVINGYKIIGANPSKSDVRSGLTLQEQVVIHKESGAKQFSIRIPPIDFPAQGINLNKAKTKVVSIDFGLKQLNYPVGVLGGKSYEEIIDALWNWKINRDIGLEYLKDCKTKALSYLRGEHKQTSYSDEVLWKETFIKYNGGFGSTYWIWENGKFIASSNNPDAEEYADDAWKIYYNIIKYGIYPPYW